MTPEDEKKTDAGQKEERKSEVGLASSNYGERRGPARPRSSDSGAGRRADSPDGGQVGAPPLGTHTPLPGWAEFLGVDEAEENDPDQLPARRGD